MEKITIPTKRSGNISFQDFVKSTLDYMFENKLLSDRELKNLQDKHYCKKTFGIDYQLLQTDESKIRDNSKRCRYWAKHPFNNGQYFACSQWWREKFNIYEPLFEKWILKIINI